MAINPTKIREAAGLSRRELAELMGFSPANGRISVQQLEQRPDWHLSTLARYIAALGGTAEIVVLVPTDEGVQELSFKL